VKRAASSAYGSRTGRLKPVFLANIILMEEILAEYDDKFAWSLRLKAQVDSAVAAIRGRALNSVISQSS
jgi:hypothetical protein